MTEVERICLAALERPSGERAAFLADACHNNDVLRQNVESLLAHASNAAQFIEQPVLAGTVVSLSGLSIGQRLGPYHIVGRLGAGGMGEVYRARDTQLGREVAIKILPPLFASDPDRLARFEREARVLASLNHPNIAAIYGIETGAAEAGRDVRALVMELVEGSTLAERIERGPPPVEEALAIVRQIADALEAAHEQGVVHRDLKPANIKIRPDGTVKVLDFGLAKLVEPRAGVAFEEVGSSQSPTLTGVEMTRGGTILGTAAYMSPEQASGKAVDRRSDVFAFGAVFYELLTGRPAFEGDSLSEVLARVLEREPDWNSLPPALSPRVRDLLQRCLEKNPRKRRRDIGDVRVEIEQALSDGMPVEASRVTPASSRRARLAWTVATLVVAVVLAATAARSYLSAPDDALETRLDITTPATSDPVSIAISPDGRKIIFAATAEGRSRFWLRSLDSTSPQPVPGTDGASYPFWSPDSRSVGFFADGKLKRIDTISGSVQELADAPNARGGTWNEDDVILFVPSFNSGAILSISANGGETANVMRSATLLPRFPQFLPDGLHFLYGVGGGDATTNGLYVGQLDDPATERLLAGAAHAVYASPRRLLFVRDGTLVAQDFDPATRTLSGRAIPVAQKISIDPAATAVAVSASAAGPIIYRSNTADAERHYVWVDRSGNQVGRLDEAERDDAAPARPSLSPDGRVLAVHRRSREGNWDVWLLQMSSGLFQRFTTDKALDLFPIWSPDATRVVFSSNRTQRDGLYEIRTTANSGSERLLFAGAATPMDWSLDGRFLLYNITAPTGDLDLWALPMLEEAKPVAVVQTASAESDGQFSPDGKWIAYQSNESGRPEIYIQPFPGPGGKQLISTNGGVQVRWRQNGKELFYIAPDGRLMAVPIRLAADGTSFERDAPVALFTTREVGARQGLVRQQYAVSADGQRFLMNTITREATTPITVILNWNANRD